MIPLGLIPSHHAARLGRRAAVIHDEVPLDWQALESASNRFANALRARGVATDDRVTLAVANSNVFFALLFGVWKVGATPNLVPSRTPPEELRSVLDVVRPTLVVCSDPLLANAVGGVGLDFADSESDAPGDVAVARHWKAMPSGGSTGRPKVIVDHRPAAFDPQAPSMDMPTDGVVLNPGPLYHNAPFSISVTALVKGCTLVSMGRFDAEEALRLIDQRRVEFVNFVPTMMHRIWNLPLPVRARYDLSSLTRVWHMAAPMPPWLKQAWIDWLGPDRIWELYGGTENTGSTVISGSEWLDKPGSVGRPVGGARIRAQDEDGAVLPPGEVGELYFMPAGGPRSTYHYLGATPREDDEGWDSIGDIGWVDEDGYVFLADRRTDLIISGGANIYPAEVEAALSEHPDVAAAVVIGLPDPDLGARVHAIVRPSQGAVPQAVLAELPAWLQGKLARYKVPRTFEATEEDLRDDAGKVRRSELRNRRL
jgi:bile acid-coenzyme A ligase